MYSGLFFSVKTSLRIAPMAAPTDTEPTTTAVAVGVMVRLFDGKVTIRIFLPFLVLWFRSSCPRAPQMSCLDIPWRPQSRTTLS